MVQFSYPAYSTTVSTLNLKNPEFGDSVDTYNGIHVNISRYGTCRTVVRDQLRIAKLQLQFENLPKSTVSQIITFFNSAKNQYIRYIDYQDINRIVLVDQSSLDVTFNDRQEDYSAELLLRIVG